MWSGGDCYKGPLRISMHVNNLYLLTQISSLWGRRRHGPLRVKLPPPPSDKTLPLPLDFYLINYLLHRIQTMKITNGVPEYSGSFVS